MAQGLVNLQHGMHERDASVLGEAVRACTTLKTLSITGAMLPMSEVRRSGPNRRSPNVTRSLLGKLKGGECIEDGRLPPSRIRSLSILMLWNAD